MRIDFHAHVLPKADHGSSDLAASCKQLKEARDAGVDLIVATPHFYPNRHRVETFLERRKKAAKEAEAAFAEYSIERRLGAEVLLCEGLENLKGLDALCIENTSCILLEMPFEPLSDRILNTIYEIQTSCQLTPIMAHVDRYMHYDIERVLALGVYAQVNASAICSLLKRGRYIKWIASGQIQAIGSDSHEDRNAYGDFSKAMKILGEKNEHLMCASADLLNISSKAYVKRS